MEINKIKPEHLFFLTAILLAGFVRFLNLGAAPLNDQEARLALDAWQLAQGVTEVGEFHLASYPGYVMLTGLLFSLLEPTNFLARFLPALTGCLLLLVPILLRDTLGKPAAILLAFGLALDPGLVAASRMVSSPAMALTFGILAVVSWQQRRAHLAGLMAALFLLSGPPAYQGLVIGLMTLLFLRFIHQPSTSENTSLGSISVSLPAFKQAIPVLVFSLLLIGTLIMQVPQGLAAASNSLMDYLAGWTGAPTVPSGRIVASLLFYQPVALIFALLSIGRTLIQRRVDWLDLLLIFWAGISLLHGLLYSGRQTLDLVWVLVPIWGLAARELARDLDISRQHWAAYGQAVLIILLAGLMWFNFAGLARSDPQMNSSAARLILMAGILALAAITTILVSMGWTWRSGKHGLILGVLGAGGLYLVSVLWGGSQLRANSPLEFWDSGSAGIQANLLEKTAIDLSVWKTGFPDRIDVIIKSDSPALHWTLRNFKQLQVVSTIPTQNLPSIIITHQNEQPPTLTAAYRGQDFDWWAYPGWVGALPQNVTSWITFRDAPLLYEQVILWARADLFPGGEIVNNNAIQP